MFFYPERVALAGLIAYLLLWLIAPLDVVFPISWSSVVFIFWCYAAFFIGCQRYLQRKRPGQRSYSSRDVRPQFKNRLFWTIVLLGAIGIGLRLFDKWFLRGASLASGALESREVLSDAAVGPIGALGGLLYPFCYVPLIMWWFRPQTNRVHSLAKWAAIILFVLPGIDALLLLSRSQMLVALGMMYFAASCVLYAGRPLPKQFVLPVLLGTTGLGLISIAAFALRLDEMKMDIAYSILNSTYGYVITPNDFATQAINDSESSIGKVLGSILPILQYYLHGFFEFGLLWDRPDHQSFLYGTEHFTPYFKVLMLFGYTPSPTLTDPYFRSGVFTTFFGPLWIDFGWFSPLLMFLFGRACKYIADRAKAGEVAAAPLHSYLCLVIFFMPVVNFIVSAQGMYIINAFILFWLLMRKRGRVAPRVGQQFLVGHCETNEILTQKN